ncbi:MAG: VCBS repeat-containing protein, partial [Bacteroidetes bacterium]|nr:VCBS repeat-containing protein [Bacteroidota bacterium]
GWMDLIVVGQFMPIRFFVNEKGTLKDQTNNYGLGKTNGWWRRILADDFDNDGDIDFMVGNIGLNSPFKASEQEPLSITYGPFYSANIINPVMAYYNNGVNYPWNTKDEIASQIPSIQKRFLHYSDYAKASLTDLLTSEQLQKSATVEVKTLQSIYLRNNGNNTFAVISLPGCAQLSALNGLVSTDINGDKKKDIILGGNLYPFRVQTGPLDASIGLLLQQDSQGSFSPLPYSQTGLFIDGDVRNIISIKTKKGYYILAAKNNGKVQVLNFTP